MIILYLHQRSYRNGTKVLTNGTHYKNCSRPLESILHAVAVQGALSSFVVLQGPVRRTGKGPRTGPDCNRFKHTNGPGPLNYFEKDWKRPQS